MKTSVALCTYNGEKYIEKQLDSIVNQTMPVDEIVICDDKSKDFTVGLIKKYINTCKIKIRLYENEQNIGFADNFKKCISLCEGDIIFLSDQDDLWEINKVSEMQSLFIENPKMMSLVTDFRLINEDDEYLFDNKSGDNPFFKAQPWEYDWCKENLYKVSLKTVLFHNIAPGCTQAIRKNIINDFLNLKSIELHDLVLNKIAAIYDGLYYYDEPLTNYRKHKNQTIGMPKYYLYKQQKRYGKLIMHDVAIIAYGILKILFVKRKKGDLLYENQEFIRYIEKCTMNGQLKKQYEEWRIIENNRKNLYDGNKNRIKSYLLQGKNNKYYTYTNEKIEKINMRLEDAFVLLKKKK